jgi:hypothetical protein
MFDVTDYERGAAALDAPAKNLMAVAAIESSGENFWMINGKPLPPIRLEAHWFSKQSGRRFDVSNPDLSSRDWNPALAARTKAGAWDQFVRAAALDPVAAAEATSWGPFQIMGFHWKALGYSSVAKFVDDVDGPDDDGQMDMFVRFVKADGRLLRAIREGDWETWEEVYNGGGYGGAYAAKIRDWLASHGNGPIAPRVLKRGDQGEDVKRLQLALGIPADGEFGPATEKAVRAAQEHFDLVVDGVVGMMTLRAIGLVA